jgi:beta-xylosidase
MKLSMRTLAAPLIAVTIVTASCASAPRSPTATLPPPPSETSAPTATEPPATVTPVPTATTTPYPVFWDDFDGEFLPGWSWIRENDALWSLSSEPGHLRIVLEGGRFHRNLLVRDVGSENFQIMTHVLFEPTSNYQIAGLLIYEDDATMVKLGRAYCNNPGSCVGNGIYFDAVRFANLLGSNFATDTTVKDQAYLRIDKIGTQLTGYYSEDGANWQTIGQHELSIADPKVGLVAGQSNVVGATAFFDYFTLMEMP